MVRVELVPELSHCIETVAKNEYRETMAKLLAAGESDENLTWTSQNQKLELKILALVHE